MAAAGLGSRRTCETYIESGRVTINGRVATLGMKADPDRDEVRFDGELLKASPSSFSYFILNKPRDVISDEDVAGRMTTAREMIPFEGHLYPVGRLDVDSEGLLLLTNDGDLAHKLTHPRFEHAKVYHVWVEGTPTEAELDIWRGGVILDGKKTRPAKVEKLHKTRDGFQLEVTLEEGMKRQIRRVAARIGHPVTRLLRVRMGPIDLGNLPTGAWRQLSAEEVSLLSQVKRSSTTKPRKPSPSRTKPASSKTRVSRQR